MIHRIADDPVKPNASIPGAWDLWCECGYGGTADSPEAAVIALARHLEPGSFLATDYWIFFDGSEGQPYLRTGRPVEDGYAFRVYRVADEEDAE